MNQRLLYVLMALLLTLAVPALAGPQADQVQSRTLDNGLKVIIWPDYDIPNIALYNWVRAGARNEYPGITGIAHYFEHMMFNGTASREAGEFDRIMSSNGGSNNAYTSDDVTVYQDWFPRSALEIVLQLEADRIANLAFDPEVIESERGVVYSERRLRVDNNNSGKLSEQLQATAFVAHPYQNPVIGWPSDIESWTMEDLQSFYKTYYAPNNLTLLLVGDIDPAEGFALVEKYLGPIPSQPPPAPLRTVEPEQKGERRIELTLPAQTPLLQMAWHSGAASDPQLPALQLLISILTRGDSSRLHRLLVEQEQAAINVGAYVHEGFDPNLTWIFATLPNGGDPARVEQLIDAAIADVVENGVTGAEVQKAKNRWTAGFWRSLSTIDGKADQLGTYEVFHGDYRKLFAAPDVVAAVTAEDIRAAAAAVLRKSNRTVGVVIPQSGEGA
ncbi:MAG: insulinase family protein [Gammaproteobacteria bacterium]|nr:insulinase family protein [Gammaproteobacteria bacterium]NNF60315.1 insulinase family protein [Gammaproteobacteria bacterium]NNM20942.1 insulinase family protein [Gammaproteobacteria bacterium]